MVGCQLPRGQLCVAAGRGLGPHVLGDTTLVHQPKGQLLAQGQVAPLLARPQPLGLRHFGQSGEEGLLHASQEHRQPQGRRQGVVGHHDPNLG